MDKELLVEDKDKQERSISDLPVILNYNIQHKQVEKIFKKHCSILKADRQL